MLQQIQNRLVPLTREERKALVDRMEDESQWNVNFGVMLGCSVLIAGLGLLQNSTAVIIGAMLVAPLMTPLIAAGLALVQGNTQLLRETGKTMLYGSVFCLLIGVVLRLIIPGSDLTLEIEARGSANLLDLFIAFFAGTAAAYAVARPKLSGALPGVAISVALVPPLAACGIAIGSTSWNIALGAGVLFVTNLVIIVLASALVFQLHGLGHARMGESLPKNIARVVFLLVIVSLFLSAPLGYQLNAQIREGQVRPATLPLNPNLYNELYNRTLDEGGVEMINAVRAGVDRGVDVLIALSSRGEIDSEFLIDMETIVHEFLGEEKVVDLIVLEATSIDYNSPLRIDNDDVERFKERQN
jgi:uncharacterized hydrophobic protein (TIGR00271 family)